MTVRSTITRRVLADELAERLRDLVIDGTLKPDDKIAEADLCARFGVSRTPLREAIKMLAAEGLVTLTPNRGARVASITAAEIAEIFPVMGALEAFAGRLAVARLDASALARLEALHGTIVDARRGNDWLGYSRANRTFHAALFEIAGNATLTGLYTQLMIRIHAVRFVAQQTPEAWDEAVSDHEAIMTALRARDAAAIGALLEAHLAHKAESVIAGLASGA